MMEIIKFDRIVSVNSQIQGHGARNLLQGEISPTNSWMCEPATDKAVLILQLERAAVLTSIHVGNAHSAFFEVLVGRAADSADQFECFLPMSSLMNPHESKTGTNPNRTRFFNRADFNEATAGKCWDRVKVVCSQPFNKYVSYGLCFLKVHGEKEVKKEGAVAKSDEKEEIAVGSFFRKRSSAGDKTLTVGERMKAAEETSPAKRTSSSSDSTTENKSGPTTEDKGKERRQSEPVGRGERKRREETKARDDKAADEDAAKRRRLDNRWKVKKPFRKLMEDVVLVISGFKNPLRADIRNMALDMGAKYSADWHSHCTHLVSAYENTPKCSQVRGRGKIVRKEWVERCHQDRKRYPWRRFALDEKDSKKAESEEEVEEESGPEVREQSGRSSEGGGEAGSSSSKAKQGGGDYDAATDDDEDKKEVDTSDYPMPYLPDMFSLKTFYLEPSLPDKAALERYIVAYNGVLAETFHEGVDFYVTDRARERAPGVVAVRPSWIWEMNGKQKLTPATPHLVA